VVEKYGTLAKRPLVLSFLNVRKIGGFERLTKLFLICDWLSKMAARSRKNGFVPSIEDEFHSSLGTTGAFEDISAVLFQHADLKGDVDLWFYRFEIQ
jgi:hypothetical protein